MKDKAIYIRTSTKEQNPENQIKDIETISGKDYILFRDEQSAWKEDIEREHFEKLKKQISMSKVSDLYVWDLDRIYRNRKRLIEFFTLCKIYKCTIHSFRQQWLEELNKIPPPFNEITHSLMLQIMGWLAEEESSKISKRIKLAIRKEEEKPAYSYKGHKWGRKELPKSAVDNVLKLFRTGMSIRKIAENVTYRSHSNIVRNISKSAVHKIIQEYNEENLLKNNKSINYLINGQ